MKGIRICEMEGKMEKVWPNVIGEYIYGENEIGLDYQRTLYTCGSKL